MCLLGSVSTPGNKLQGGISVSEMIVPMEIVSWGHFMFSGVLVPLNKPF